LKALAPPVASPGRDREGEMRRREMRRGEMRKREIWRSEMRTRRGIQDP
jgi:hypothetical protein